MNVIERARQLRAKQEQMAVGLPDEEALEYPEMFPAWSGASVDYSAGDRLRYNDTLYVVLQDHISQEKWTPQEAPSLFAKVLIPDPGKIPEWEQPDSTNPYMIGDKVMFNSKVYECQINDCVWSPADYPAGWKEVTE